MAASSTVTEDGGLNLSVSEEQMKAGLKAFEAAQLRLFGKMVSMMLQLPPLDLSTACRNGDLLIRFVERLSSRQLGIPFSDPATPESKLKTIGRIQKLLDFLKSEKLNITADAQNIFEADVKLTLGLIWTVVYHYHIANKQKILAWVQQVAGQYDLTAKNYTTAFSDGLVLASLAIALADLHKYDHKFVWEKIKSLSSTERIRLTLELTEKLGIPALLEVEDLDLPRPDERIVLTFVSFIYNSFHGAPIPIPKPPEPVIEVPDRSAEIEALMQKIAKLKGRVSTLKSELKSERAQSEKYREMMEGELQEINVAYEILSQKLVSEQQTVSNMQQKITELTKKFTLSQAPAASNIPPPCNDVTLVVVSVEGRSSLWRADMDSMYTAVHQFNRLVRTRLVGCDGYEVKQEAETFTVAFSSAPHALQFALAIQEELLDAEWPEGLMTQPAAQQVKTPDGEVIFSGLRPAVSIHSGEPMLDKDPASGRYQYSGPDLNRVLAIASVCQGGQILVSNDTNHRIAEALAMLGSPDVFPVGEVCFSELSESLVLYQILPQRLKTRIFKPLPTPEKVSAIMVSLESEISLLEKENVKLRAALSSLHEQSQQQQTKVSNVIAWFKSNNRSKSVRESRRDLVSDEISQILSQHRNLENSLAVSADQTADLERNMVALRQALANAEKATELLSIRYTELQHEHAKCGTVPPPPVAPETLFFKDAPVEMLVRAPREVLTLLRIHPHLVITPDPFKHGNWLIGSRSYTLQQIYNREIDSSDLDKKLHEPPRSLTSAPKTRRNTSRLSMFGLSFGKSTEFPRGSLTAREFPTRDANTSPPPDSGRRPTGPSSSLHNMTDASVPASERPTLPPSAPIAAPIPSPTPVAASSSGSLPPEPDSSPPPPTKSSRKSHRKTRK